LANNKLSGEIPIDLNNCIELVSLSLSSDFQSNTFTGNVPDFSSLKKLKVLQLLCTGLNAAIFPEWIRSNDSLTTLVIGGFLSGAIPEWIGDLSELTILQIIDNKMNGEIPSSIGNLTKLTNLSLRRNNLSGTIPQSIGNLKSLTTQLSLRGNQLSGAIPTSLFKLSGLKNLYLYDNLLTSGLSNIPKNTFDSVFIYNNQFNFDELEHIITATNYQYAPQDSLGVTHDTTVAQNKEFRIRSQAGETANNRYKWFKNGVEIPSVTAKELVISSVKKADEGVYSYQATNTVVANLALYARPITLKVQDGTGVEENETSILATLEPNPANSTITIHLLNPSNNFKAITVHDALGNLVNTINVNPYRDTYQIDVQNLSNGVYVLKSTLDDKCMSKVFVVIHR
jgi:hypothetical protein